MWPISKPFIWLSIFIIIMTAAMDARARCMENVCIGDEIESLSVKWRDVNLNYYDEKFVETELQDRSVQDVYYDYNEKLIADRNVLLEILPYVIRNQRFDNKVLAELNKVRAICTSLTLTGEVENNSKSRLFVTFRAVPSNKGRGTLRVVQIEKQFNVMAPHLRPNDAILFENLKTELKKIYPSMVVVRDIDGRISSMEMQQANAILGFRFVSDVSNPLVLKLLDDENIDMIEDSEQAHPLCQRDS
ncbi:hypothetical protein [Pleionea mediterranea]|uniref:Uncharacterized protein n=1 Tax=Pleionea mediterranea TaxID=523701 RepID=A0A316FHJ7_9GAMM|nr:hypothetical protein [Pleionea mediterranea]PWK47280.1 hypothetical protein C8D97_11125 [Pleionea mediterranea]